MAASWGHSFHKLINVLHEHHMAKTEQLAQMWEVSRHAQEQSFPGDVSRLKREASRPSWQMSGLFKKQTAALPQDFSLIKNKQLPEKSIPFPILHPRLQMIN